MSWFKTLPIAYQGLVDQIRILNFSVPTQELKHLLPSQLKPLDFEGRVMISMADLQIRQLRPKRMPKWPSLNYRHVAFRLLIERDEPDEGERPAIYFLKSFCEHTCIICGGALFTDYHMCKAKIEGNDQVQIECGSEFLQYAVSHRKCSLNPDDLEQTAVLNTAYAVHGEQLWETHIKPICWPLEPMHCSSFSTNMFKDARLEAAYIVKGNLCFERSAPKSLSSVQRREHVRPVRVRCSPL